MGTDLERLGGSELTERLLLNADHMSPTQLSELIGGVMSAARVRVYVSELLNDVDWLTEAQEDRLVTLKLRRLLAILENRFADNDNITLQLKLLKEIGGRLDKRRAATEVEIDRYHANVGRQMAQAVDIALAHMRGALKGDIDPEKWDAALLDAMVYAESKIAEKQIEAA